MCFFMIVGIQKGLEELKKQLQNKGYYVVEVEKYKHPIDAYVYIGTRAEGVIEGLSITNQFYTGMESRESKGLGVLMINAYNKTIEEIEQILQDRVYTPLF